ncbi:MAG: hypothetical protein EOP60_12935 [Sphingomonadales bacterium]|nr:MAG: hypothetical protein EOP60_12935 [Sphingomonadales bacterium]
MERSRTGQQKWQHISLLLLACALLLRLPAGFMPQANAQGVAFGWCNAVSPEIAAEGRKLLEQALADRPAKHESKSDEPCPFAAAAQPMAAADPFPLLAPGILSAHFHVPQPSPAPGRGLAAPPPFSTGPPLLG